jgi:hypothetical protein
MRFNNKWLNYLMDSSIAPGIPYFAHVYLPEKDTFKFKDLAEIYQPFLTVVNVGAFIQASKAISFYLKS